MNGVENRVVMLTGAKGVLGQAVAAAVQAAGGKLMLVDRAPAGDGRALPLCASTVSTLTTRRPRLRPVRGTRSEKSMRSSM